MHIYDYCNTIPYNLTKHNELYSYLWDITIYFSEMLIMSLTQKRLSL